MSDAVDAAPESPKRSSGRHRPPLHDEGLGRGLVRHDEQAHQALAEALADLDAYETDIAEADLANETLRCALLDFQRRYEAALAPERRRLTRIQMLLHHVARQRYALRMAGQTQGAQQRANDARRTRELLAFRRARPQGASTQASSPGVPSAAEADGEGNASATAAAEAHAADSAEAQPSWHARRAHANVRLKQAFRALARRTHPDLAQSEADRARRSRQMAHINALYAGGELERLEALAAQADAAALAHDAARATEVPVRQRLEEAKRRLAWFAAVARSLAQEHEALCASPTAELWEALEGGAAGRGLRPWLLRELRAQLRQQAEDDLNAVPRAMRALELAVHEHNHARLAEAAPNDAPSARGLARPAADALVATNFDPHTDQRDVRFALEALAMRRVPPRIAEWGRRLSARAESEPAFVRLMLLTYVVQLAPGQMPGLETYDELAERFAAAGRADGGADLNEALVQADGLVEYAPERVAPGQLRCRLRFRDRALMAVIPQALRDFGVRELFCGLLAHLGEAMACNAPRCRRARVFAVPLFVVRGLCDVRALACPHCGRVLRQYVLARGDDVHKVLNRAYLDFELVVEWTVSLGATTVGLQYLPQRARTLTCAALRRDAHRELFVRHDVAVPLHALQLGHDGRALPDGARLDGLLERKLRLSFTSQSPIDVVEATARLRRAVQRRYVATPDH